MGFLGVAKVVVMILAGLATIAASIHDVRYREKETNKVSPLMIVGCVVAGLVVANFVFGKKPVPTIGLPALSVGADAPKPFSIRQQQADEAAAAIAQKFREADEQAWIDEQIERAQGYFASGKQSTSSKS